MCHLKIRPEYIKMQWLTNSRCHYETPTAGLGHKRKRLTWQGLCNVSVGVKTKVSLQAAVRPGQKVKALKPTREMRREVSRDSHLFPPGSLWAPFAVAALHISLLTGSGGWVVWWWCVCVGGEVRWSHPLNPTRWSVWKLFCLVQVVVGLYFLRMQYNATTWNVDIAADSTCSVADIYPVTIKAILILYLTISPSAVHRH